MVRVVPRDLLPLPLDGMGGTLPRRSLGRKCRQRLSSETAQRQRINAAAAALNNLYGGRDEPGLRPSESQLEALLHLEAAIKADPPPYPSEDAEESLMAILGSRPGDYSLPESTSMAALSAESIIAWPTTAGSADLLSCLPLEHSGIARGERAGLVRPAEEQAQMIKENGRANIYWDPLLKQDGEAYVSFLHELKSRDMCAFQVEKPLEQVGVFFVVRKDGRLRLI